MVLNLRKFFLKLFIKELNFRKQEMVFDKFDLEM